MQGPTSVTYTKQSFHTSTFNPRCVVDEIDALNFCIAASASILCLAGLLVYILTEGAAHSSALTAVSAVGKTDVAYARAVLRVTQISAKVVLSMYRNC
jgi:hypothetical protein